MKRNPIEHKMKSYYDSVKFHKIKPRFFYTQCDKCKNEFKKQTMYECSFNDDFFENHHNYVKGCTECFSSIDEFKKFCYEHVILSKDDWYYDGKPCTPVAKRMALQLEKKSNHKSSIFVTNQTIDESKTDLQKENWIKSWDKWMNENVDINVLKFIADILYHNPSSQNDSIHNLFASGYCYHFAVLLQTVFQRGTICWLLNRSHCVWLDGDINNIENAIVYDISGIYMEYSKDELIPWDILPEDIKMAFRHNPHEKGIMTKTRLYSREEFDFTLLTK